MIDLFSIVKESRFGGGQGSVQGRERFTSGEGAKGRASKGNVKSQKSRVKVYPTIMDALKRGYFGQIFSTTGSKRLYVITKQKWGTDSEQRVGNKVAKGFSPGTIPSSFKTIKGYAVRTMARHAGQKSRRFTGGRYWKSRRQGDFE